MGYIENNLIQNEYIVFSTMFHWWIWFRTIVRTILICIVFLGIVAVGLLISSVLGKQTSSASANGINTLIIVLAALALLLICVSGFIVAFINLIAWATSELALTNRRVISKQGLFSRRISELYLTQFEACQLSESIIGRLLGYKTIILIGTGGTPYNYPLVPRADELRNRIIELVSANSSTNAANRQPQ